MQSCLLCRICASNRGKFRAGPTGCRKEIFKQRDINSFGGAEPCPFSPYSDINVKDTSVREALRSHLFLELQSGDVLMEEHAGGCVLFERKEKVASLLAEGSKIEKTEER